MHGEHKVPGGKLVVVDFEVSDNKLRHVRTSGDFFLEPDSALDRINAALEGQDSSAGIEALGAAIRAGLDDDTAMHGFAPEDVARAIHKALAAGDEA